MFIRRDCSHSVTCVTIGKPDDRADVTIGGESLRAGFRAAAPAPRITPTEVFSRSRVKHLVKLRNAVAVETEAASRRRNANAADRFRCASILHAAMRLMPALVAFEDPNFGAVPFHLIG